MKWVGKQLFIDPPKRPKKITGTRFGAVLGVNTWNTPFKAWCEVTRTYEEPFVDNKYTIAGKTIEPKQAEYMKEAYYMNVQSPTDVYGEDYFNKTHGDFFERVETFGGMWDYLRIGPDGKPDAVLEMKTSKRVEDWENDIPEYYALQAALYAFFLSVDQVIMVASFLDESDYDHPENFIPSASNTIVKPFKVSERYPDFSQKIGEVYDWWNKYVKGGVSPEYDEKKDAEILKALRTNNLNPETDINELLTEAEKLSTEIYESTYAVIDKKNRLDTVKEIIKQYMSEHFREGDTKVNLTGPNTIWTLSKTTKKEVDKKALERDGLLEQYQKETVTERLTTSKKKEE